MKKLRHTKGCSQFSKLMLLICGRAEFWTQIFLHPKPCSFNFTSKVKWSEVKWSHSVMSDSLRPHGLEPAQAPLSMGFSRQEYWSGLPFPSPGDLPNPGIKPGSPALQADALSSEPPGKPSKGYRISWWTDSLIFSHLILSSISYDLHLDIKR